MEDGMWVEHCGGERAWIPAERFEMVPWEMTPAQPDATLGEWMEAEPETVAA